MPHMASRERKVVTVLFADLVGFTSRAVELDPEDVEAILRPYHERLRSELERHGGTVEKFIGDAVVALFGAPVAHEDDPERAVRAALAVQEAIAELNESSPKLALQVRIGVSSGEALGRRGCAVRRGRAHGDGRRHEHSRPSPAGRTGRGRAGGGSDVPCNSRGDRVSRSRTRRGKGEDEAGPLRGSP